MTDALAARRPIVCAAGLVTWLAGLALSQDPATDVPTAGNSAAGNKAVAEIMRTHPGRGVMADDSSPTPAKQAVQEFRVREGLDIQLVASEPEVTQPLFLSWDSRGRMWVVQYRQYQFPAGLKVVRYDQHLRAVFDKVPQPPPHGVRGADKITVFDDTDGDGKYDHHRDVITGLNIATSVQVGRGGIWVLSPPYLLFYPDADRDDVPDADPVVVLSGFGIQDTHAVANSLTWGPDGWLYGANGSTTAGTVSSAVTKGVSFQGQCIWRYHPGTQKFEIFAEGGGNTFSLEIDSRGLLFAGTNGGNTRGWYFPQGSYSRKSWGKHGPLTNPYAFGFFPPMGFEGDGRRFPQAFCIYEGGRLPAEFAGTIIAPNSLHNLVWNSQLIPDGSTFRTVDMPNLLESPDRWFRPVYCGVGPDGAVYMTDWYDTRLSHVSPIDDWHKESGRIYRIVPEVERSEDRVDSAAPAEVRPALPSGDLASASSDDLIKCFDDPNKWMRQRAVLELGWRGDRDVADRLVSLVTKQASLESLWALNLMDELTTERAAGWLDHRDPNIRRWVIRLLGDRHEGHPRLAEIAAAETDVRVRSQLAATAKRIGPEVGLAIVRQLIKHDEDARDPHLPLMIWWAIEAHCDAWESVVALFSDPQVWSRPLVRQTVTERLMQRYAAAGSPADLRHCVRLLELAPTQQDRNALMVGLTRAFQGQRLPPLPDALTAAIEQHRASLGNLGLVLGVQQGDTKSLQQAVGVLSDRSTPLALRIELAGALGEASHPAALTPLLALATGRATDEAALQRVAIGSLANYQDSSIADRLIGAFGGAISNEHGLRAAACRTLAARPTWAQQLLAEIRQWRLDASDVPVDVVQQLRTYEQPELAAAVVQAFGPAVEVGAPEKVAEIRRLKSVLLDAADHFDDAARLAAGQRLFKDRCGNCHQLFGEGQRVGPPLDGYDRDNLDFWLPAIVSPGLEIREGFQSYLVLTNDGRLINGMITDRNPSTVSLRNVEQETVTLSRDRIESLKALPTSLMPDDVLHGMTDDQVVSLFAYLMQGTQR